MTGVIWIGDPESLVDVLLYDNLHVLLWVGALFFALRGITQNDIWILSYYGDDVTYW